MTPLFRLTNERRVPLVDVTLGQSIWKQYHLKVIALDERNVACRKGRQKDDAKRMQKVNQKKSMLLKF